MSSSSDEEELTRESTPPPEILNDAQNTMDTLPAKSREKYMLTYETFIRWMNDKSMPSFSEDVLMTYFRELATKYKPASLWNIQSKLKTTLRVKNGVDIKSYSNLTAFIRSVSVGSTSKKAKALSLRNIEKFLAEAPDEIYLATKVALIFGITGACRRHELNNLRTRDIENHGNMLLVKIPNERTKMPRTFTVHGQFYEIVKKYESLRSKKAKTDRFFQNFQHGKCTCQPIGINKFGSMPRQIAKFLGLPDADAYTGHSFRRTSAKLLANSGVDILTLKCLSAANTVAEPCAEEYTNQTANISNNVIEVTFDLDSKKSGPGLQPSTSYTKEQSPTSANTGNRIIDVNLEPDSNKFCPELQISNEDFKLSPAANNDLSMSPISVNTSNDMLDMNFEPDAKKSCPGLQHSTYVNDEIMLSPNFDHSQLSTNVDPLDSSKQVSNIQVSNNSKSVTYNFINCNFYNCFNK